MTLHTKRGVMLVVLVVGLGFFWQPVARGYFLGDDWWLINDHDWSRVPRYFAGNWTDGSQGTGGFYRPLVRMSFLLDSALYGMNPVGYHATNLLLHIVNAFLIAQLGALILGSPIFGLIAGLLFVVFPLAHEPVLWISARTALLPTCFVLLSTYLFIQHLRTERRVLYLLALCAYLLGLFSLESALVTPLLLLAYHFSQGRENVRRLAVRRIAVQIVPFLLIAGVYGIIRHASLGFWIGGYGVEGRALSPARAYETLCNYLLRLALPSEATVDPLNIRNMFVGWLALSAVGVTVLILVVAPRSGAIRYLTLWLVISTLPFLSYPHLARFYYLPAAVFCLLLASFLALFAPKNGSQRRLRVAFIAAVSATLFIYYSYLLMRVSDIWTIASDGVRTFVSNAQEVIGDPSSPRHYCFFQDSMELMSENPLTHYNGTPLLHFDFPAVAVNKIYKDRNSNVIAHWGIPPGFKDFENAEVLKVRTDFSLERYRITEEKDYNWNFSRPTEGWVARNDLLPLRSRSAYPAYMITADFPYLGSPRIDFPQPAFATLQCDIRIEGMKKRESGTWILFAHDHQGRQRKLTFSMPFDPSPERFQQRTAQLGSYPNLDGIIFNPTFGRFVVFQIREVRLYLYRLEKL